MLQVTANGPYGKETHPAMPVTLDELLVELAACFAAGADGVHLHVRDDLDAETLDPRHVYETCAQVRQLAADSRQSVEIGLTTGAWIVPDVAERIAMIREWEGVDCATVNLSEPCFEQVMAALQDAGIGIDVGLWAPQEIDWFVASGFVPLVQRVSIELAPGEPYFLAGDPLTVAASVNQTLDEAGSTCRRLTHGMGAWTWPLVEDAFRRGHDTRVGFEDSILLPSGRKAQSNAELVVAARELAKRIRGS